MSLEDDSLEGSGVVQENPIIKESESKYQSGIEHRFIRNPEARFLADAPVMTLFNKENKWRSVMDIVDDTGLAERTIRYLVRRFTKHEIFEVTKRKKSGGVDKPRNAHLYRLITKNKDDTRRDTRKNETPKK